MGAQDKLIPTAIALANNLSGVKTSTNNTFKLQPNIKTKWNNPFINVIKFFASIYSKQNKMSTGDMAWNHELNSGSPLDPSYTLNQGLNQLTLGAVISVTEDEWNSFQTTISGCYNIIKWLPASPTLPYSVIELNNMYTSAGVYSTSSNSILGADGCVLANNLSKDGPDYAWHNAWNNLKVPYDKALKISTPFIAPIAPLAAGSDKNFYRATGNRIWFFNQNLVEYIPPR